MTHDLSLANVDQQPYDVDWSEWNESTGEPPAEAVLPDVTADILDNTYWKHQDDWRTEFADEDGDDDETLEAAREAFEEDDQSYTEWRDGFYPVMNSAWPIDLPYRADVESIAAKIDDWAGCVSLMRMTDAFDNWGDPKYALALTGGGMDLSWNLAAAYVAAGCVPPMRLLRDLPNYGGGGSNIGEEATRAVLDASDKAASHLRNVANQINESAGKVRRHLNNEVA